MRCLAFLQVLSVDQWGLEVSLLPSLAVCGPGSLDLQSAEDPSVLCFSASKGKSTLQAGSALGLMAYLYARYYWWGFKLKMSWPLIFLFSRLEDVWIVIMSQSFVQLMWSCDLLFNLPAAFHLTTKGISQGLWLGNDQITARNWKRWSMLWFLPLTCFS